MAGRNLTTRPRVHVRTLVPILAGLLALLPGRGTADAGAEPPGAPATKPIAPAVSLGTGLLLEPALTLPEFTRERFAAAMETTATATRCTGSIRIRSGCWWISATCRRTAV